jgi:hypothetical protein
MFHHCYLRQGVLYVPTVGKRGGAYTDIEPVAVVPITDVDGLRRAWIETIARKNPPVPLQKGKRSPPVVLKHAGVKTWAAFERNASTWNIKENNGNYRIGGYRKHPDGYWVEDREKDIEFPPGTTIEAVVDRMIAILQEASEKTKQ